MPTPLTTPQKSGNEVRIRSETNHKINAKSGPETVVIAKKPPSISTKSTIKYTGELRLSHFRFIAIEQIATVSNFCQVTKGRREKHLKILW